MDCFDEDKMMKRLSRIEGQIRGIKRMVEEKKSCNELLIQISAAKSALHRAGQELLEGHLGHCVHDAIARGDAKQALKELSGVIEIFSRISKG